MDELVMFTWPGVAIVLTGLIKWGTERLKKHAPAALWPVLNVVIAAVLTAVKGTADPSMLVGNVVAAIVGALGLNKFWDVAQGKVNAVRPRDKRRLRAWK
jgi:hypothetical protein